jgi:hypothetical protein
MCRAYRTPEKEIVEKVLTAAHRRRLSRCAVQKLKVLLSGGIPVDTNFLKAHAERCRLLAENADEFTKRRLFDLAAHYDKRLKAAGPLAATRFLKAPLNTKDTSTQI